MTAQDLERRASEYCSRNCLAIRHQLGAGVHGIVFECDCQPGPGRCAIKIHGYEEYYRRERDIYLRLKELDVNRFAGCFAPTILEYDDTLWIIEMSVVTRPFVLDFAGAYLDAPPNFSDDVLADWEAEKREQFGLRWNDAKAVLREMERLGVFMVDVNPGNISFGA